MYGNNKQHRAFNTHLKRFHLCASLHFINQTLPDLCNLTFVTIFFCLKGKNHTYSIMLFVSCLLPKELKSKPSFKIIDSYITTQVPFDCGFEGL